MPYEVKRTMQGFTIVNADATVTPIPDVFKGAGAKAKAQAKADELNGTPAKADAKTDTGETAQGGRGTAHRGEKFRGQ